MAPERVCNIRQELGDCCRIKMQKAVVLNGT